MTQRIPFGLDRLPRTLSPDDTRLPGVTVGHCKLRLNTEPLPAEIMASAMPGHATRVAAMRHYLRGLCGDYAPQRLRFVDAYLDAMVALLEAHSDELTRRLQRYDGLYEPQDFLWSALRPLPRAWLPASSGMVLVDFAFWDGTQAIAIDVGQGATGIAACRITPDVLTGDAQTLLAALPDGFRDFWRGDALPASPFRRPIPRGVLGESEHLSLRVDHRPAADPP